MHKPTPLLLLGCCVDPPCACVQGELRTEPFPLRVYQEYLTRYRPAPDLRKEDREAIETELKSDLPDGYVGQVLYGVR